MHRASELRVATPNGLCSARAAWRRVRYPIVAAVRLRSGTGACTLTCATQLQRRRRTNMRSPERAARDAAMHAMDLLGPIGAATGSAASIVEVSVMRPTCSPR